MRFSVYMDQQIAPAAREVLVKDLTMLSGRFQ